MTAGLVGIVVKTQAVVNIPKAYDDDRFNPAFDIASGYTTESILGLPAALIVPIVSSMMASSIFIIL